MRGGVFYEHGDNSVLRVADDLPIPEPGPGQVRVRIRAAALNRLDLWVRTGWKGLNLHLPHVVGADGAGIVDALGYGVDTWEVGDRVCIDPTVVPSGCADAMAGYENLCDDAGILGEHHPGVAAEYAVVPARNLLRLPDHVDYEEAAAAGLVFVTAWHSLITRGGLKPVETVLIVGAGGGVNSASIQIAKLAGAHVIVVGSDAERCEQAKTLGADVTINRAEHENWSKEVYRLTEKRGVDIVIDNVGKATLFSSIRSVRRGGRILIVGNTSGHDFDLDIRYLFSKQISLIGSTMGPHRDFITVMNLIFEGRLNPVIGARLPLEDLKQAYELLEQGETFGKIVLSI